MDSILEELTTNFGKVAARLERQNYWINSHVAKGPIIITWRAKRWRPDSRLWIVADQKTEGYPSKNFVGHNILTGGNLRGFGGDIPETPLKLYQKQIEEELGGRWKLGSSLRPAITIFGDYLESYSVADHGNEEMRKVIPVTNGDIYAIVSLFGSTIEGENLQDELQIPSRMLTPANLKNKILKRIGSTESGLAIMTINDLKGGQINNFCAGDGLRLVDYLETMYEIEGLSVAVPRGTSARLYQTTPLTPYIQHGTMQYMRDTMQYSRVNPFRNKTTPQSPFTLT